jgi:hypothetical protein
MRPAKFQGPHSEKPLTKPAAIEDVTPVFPCNLQKL